jgi:hypothetical protein
VFASGPDAAGWIQVDSRFSGESAQAAAPVWQIRELPAGPLFLLLFRRNE